MANLFFYAYLISALLTVCSMVHAFVGARVITAWDILGALILVSMPLLNTILGLVWLSDAMDRIEVYRKT